MSVRVLAIVWERYPSGGSELLALLALADWSDDDGRCWPSVGSIAKKTRLSRSQAQRVVHRLIDEKFVAVIGNENGGAPGASRQYQINLDLLTGRMGATGSASATGRMGAADGSHGCAETGSTGATQTVIEPSITTKKVSRSKKSEITLKQFMENCKASGEQSIPENDPVFEYAETVGLNQEMIAICWQEFKAAFLQDQSKRQRDWRAHFRNAVRRNWYKLWYLKEGEAAQWTSVGEQARRAAA